MVNVRLLEEMAVGKIPGLLGPARDSAVGLSVAVANTMICYIGKRMSSLGVYVWLGLLF